MITNIESELDYEKIFLRNHNRGKFLYEIDSRIKTHLELINKNNLEKYTIPESKQKLSNYFKDKYNIIFIPDSISTSNLDVSDNRILNENELKSLLYKRNNIQKPTKDNIINHIHHNYDLLVESLNIFVKEYPSLINDARNSEDILKYLEDFIKKTPNFFSLIYNTIIIRIDPMQRVTNIVRNMHSLVHGINGIHDNVCRDQYNYVKELDDNTVKNIIQERKNNILNILSRKNKFSEGEKLLVDHLKFEEISKSSDNCSDMNFYWSKADIPQYATKNCNGTPELADYNRLINENKNGRPTILGSLWDIDGYSKCTSLYQSDVFLSGRYDLENISWSTLINKVYTKCSTQKQMIFPIRFILPKNTRIYRYITEENFSNLFYCGAFIVPLIGSCEHHKFNKVVFSYYGDSVKNHMYFLYYDNKIQHFRLYNHRGNLCDYLLKDTLSLHGLVDKINIRYVELNNLFYEEGLKIYKFNNNDPKYDTYFLSKYSLKEIRELYEKIGFSNTLLGNMLGKLNKIELKKNKTTKMFSFGDEKDPDEDIIKAHISKLKNSSKFTPIQTPNQKRNTIYTDLKYSSKRDIEKLDVRVNKEYVMEKDKEAKDHYNQIVSDLVKKHPHIDKKIMFHMKGSNNYNYYNYNNSLIDVTCTDNYKKEIEKIIDEYEKVTKGKKLNLSDINNKDFETRLREPTEEEVKTFFLNRQKSLDSIKQEPFYSKYNLDKLNLDLTSGKPCPENIVWTDTDHPDKIEVSSCDSFDVHELPYLKQYYPEIIKVNNSKNLSDNEKQELLHKLRPSMLGLVSDQIAFDNCQKYFNTRFSVDSSKFTSKYFNWTLDLNRMYIECTLNNSKILFPFMFVYPDFTKFGRFNSFHPKMTYKYFGLLTIPFTDDRSNKHPYEIFFYHIFEETYNGISKLVSFNHRGEIVTPGTFYGQYKVSYYELNHLYYYKPKLYTYLYKPSKKFSNKIYFFSKKSMQEIISEYEKYTEFFNKEELENIINNLIPINLTKNETTKLFDFIEPQIGGSHLNFSTGEKYLLKNTPYTKLNIKMTSKQVYHDPNVYPLDLFKKYVNKYNILKQKLTDENLWDYGLKTVYKYRPLRKTFYYSTTQYNTKDVKYNKKYKPLYDFSIVINDKKTTGILQHDFFYDDSIGLLEYYLNNNLVNSESKILLITPTSGYYEALTFYLTKYLYCNKYKNIEIIIPSYIYGTKYDFRVAKGIIDLFNLKYKICDKPFNNDIIENIISEINSKKDYILVDLKMVDPDIKYHRDQLNHTYFISQLCIALNVLKPGGILHISLPCISTAVTSQIVYYLKGLFEKSSLYHTEITYGSYYFYSLMLYNYKGISDLDMKQLLDLNKKLYEIDNTGFSKYNILDKEERSIFEVDKEITTNSQKTFIGKILDYEDKEFDNSILKFNKIYLKRFGKLLDELDIFLKSHKDPQYIDYQNQYSIGESISFAKKIDIELRPGIVDNLDYDSFYKKLVYQIFTIDNVINYKFANRNTQYTIFPHNRDDKIYRQINRIMIQYYSVGNIIDTRDPDAYDYVKKYVRYYERSLADKIKDDFGISINGRRVSRAWLKFFEVLHETDVLKVENDLNSFHICEAPGTFIMSTSIFLKYFKIGKTMNWKAQSLKDSAIFDDYGFIKNNPLNWDFGPKNTGDITDTDNIKYYIKANKKVNFVTADCGTSWDERNLTGKLKISMIIFILGILNKGGNFVFKSLMPIIEPDIISLYYILYCSFEKLIFFKPLQNSWSPEFYVVGINYTNVVTPDNYKILLNHIEQYTPESENICLVKEDEQYQIFITQLEKIADELRKNFRFAIFRNIFFVDQWNNLTKDEKENIKGYITDKNNEWIDHFIRGKI